MVMSLQPKCRSGIPDVFYAQRVRMLVERGVLQAQGDLTRMGCWRSAHPAAGLRQPRPRWNCAYIYLLEGHMLKSIQKMEAAKAMKEGCAWNRTRCRAESC
jgi:hypothetical protein